MHVVRESPIVPNGLARFQRMRKAVQVVLAMHEMISRGREVRIAAYVQRSVGEQMLTGGIRPVDKWTSIICLEVFLFKGIGAFCGQPEVGELIKSTASRDGLVGRVAASDCARPVSIEILVVNEWPSLGHSD